MKMTPIRFDARREILIPGNEEKTLTFAVEHWLTIAAEAIQDHGFFAVALSGGSTPKKIFQKLAKLPDVIDWSKVYLFWSDERSVPPDDPDSNYHMAIEAGELKNLPLAPHHIFRMIAEENIEENAGAYERLIQEKLGSHSFDLVMLGMGEDGHTASLFPDTKALHIKGRLVVANEVPQKNTWRMTFTYECINRARHIAIYVMGSDKAKMVKKVLTSQLDFDLFPSQNIGTAENPALWILDTQSSQNLYPLHFKNWFNDKIDN